MIEYIINPQDYIFPYSPENVRNRIFVNNYDYRIDKFNHYEYLCHYLEAIECHYILEEINYIDGDYLDDYLHYYGSCFIPPSKICKRFHFFKENPEEISHLLNDAYDPELHFIDSLQSKYLGFIVIKPIPNMIGRCCISPYLDINSDCLNGQFLDTQHILTLRSYDVHLFGIKLSIDSLAFQQQDTVISMCATAALWTIFQKANKEFGYYTPNPYEITKKANEFTQKRPFPSSGLNFIQIIDTIRSYGMDLEVSGITSVKDPYRDFLAYCYAYLRGGFPIFLGVNIEMEGTGTKGNHAIAVLGYKLDREIPRDLELPMVGNHIKFFYAHDDNLGPFAKFEMQIYKEPRDGFNFGFNCPEYGEKIYPTGLIIPLYKKIRYPFPKIQEALEEILTLFQMVDPDSFSPSELDPQWDCYITKSNDYKKQIMESKLPIIDNRKTEFLISTLPRFIWRSTFLLKGNAVFDLIADATQAVNMFPFLKIIFFYDEFKNIFMNAVHLITDTKDNYPEFPNLRNFLMETVQSLESSKEDPPSV